MSGYQVLEDIERMRKYDFVLVCLSGEDIEQFFPKCGELRPVGNKAKTPAIIVHEGNVYRLARQEAIEYQYRGGDHCRDTECALGQFNSPGTFKNADCVNLRCAFQGL